MIESVKTLELENEVENMQMEKISFTTNIPQNKFISNTFLFIFFTHIICRKVIIDFKLKCVIFTKLKYCLPFQFNMQKQL